MRAFLLPLSYLLLLLLLFSGCTEPGSAPIQRSFYYWRSSFQLNAAEQSALKEHAVQQLYVKFFDVEWNEESKRPQPIATVRFKDSLPAGLRITPVVFITNETLLQADSAQVDDLAINITRLLSSMVTNNQLLLSGEVQIDCDWTGTTKDRYFRLLQLLKQQPFLKNKLLSATIRLHQLKFINETGAPPVDKGLLMAYNMGNLRNPATTNSIISTEELDKYIHKLRYYPLPLDVALPLFDWYVWFHQNEYKGLFYPQQLGLNGGQEKITFTSDTSINGYAFKKGDWLRYEGSPIEVLTATAKRLKNKLPAKERTIILYHLDQELLSKYQKNELKNLFERFH
jgi:hypothetical protein